MWQNVNNWWVQVKDFFFLLFIIGFPDGSVGKKICLPMQETQVCSLVWEKPLEEKMPTHSSRLAWKIPWTKEPGGLQSKELQSQTQLSTNLLFFILNNNFWKVKHFLEKVYGGLISNWNQIDGENSFICIIVIFF